MKFYSYALIILVCFTSCKNRKTIPVSVAHVVVSIPEPASDNHAFHVATDKLNNFFVAGIFRSGGPFKWDDLHFVSRTTSGQDAYMGKFDREGHCQWLKSIDGLGTYLTYGVATDRDGNMYVIATFDLDCTVDGSPVSSSYSIGGYTESVLAKFSPDGTLRWINKFSNMSSSGTNTVSSITVNSNNEIICAGHFFQKMEVPSTDGGTFELTAYHSNNIFIASFNTEGVRLWSRSYGIFDEQSPQVTTDNENSIWMVGYYHHQTTIGDFTLVSTMGEAENLFIAKFDNLGEPLWLFGNTATEGYVKHAGIVCDLEGNGYVSGTFNRKIIIEPQSATSATDFSNIFVLKLQPDGVATNLASITGTGEMSGGAINRGINDQILLTGSFVNTMHISSAAETYSATGTNPDIFVANLNTELVPKWVDASHDIDREISYSIVAGGSKIGFVGDFKGDFIYDDSHLTSRGMSSYLAIRGY